MADETVQNPSEAAAAFLTEHGHGLDDPEPSAEPEGHTDSQDVEPEGTEEPSQSPKIRIKWNGEEREVSLDEARDLAEKGFDYTQKSQALAEQRRQMEHLAQMQEYMKQDPRFAQHLMAYFAGQGQQGASQQGQPQDFNRQFFRQLAQNPQQALTQMYQQMKAQDPDFRELRQKVNQFDERFQETQRQQELQALKSRYKLNDDEAKKLGNFAKENGLQNMDHAYWAMYGPQVKERAVQEYVQGKRQPKPPVARSRGGMTSSSAKTPSTFEESRAAAMTFLRQAARNE